MFRNTFAVIGFLAVISYYKPQIVKAVPALAIVPFPQIVFEGQGKKEPEKPNLISPADKEDTATNSTTTSPTPAPSPKDKKWGIHFELKSNIGEQR